MTPNDAWAFMVSASRGFRAPHMTDLGTFGLTGSGFEVAAPDVAGLNGTVGTTADASAVSTGTAVAQVGPETSMQYEGSVRYRHRRFRSELTLFVNNVHDNIQKQALILPQGAVGIVLGGSPITSQNANGAVFVAATTVPVLVRANFDDARIWGIEHGAELRAGDVRVRSAFTYLRARDVNTDLPPNIEGGTPAPDLWLSARWQQDGGRIWVEPYAHVGMGPDASLLARSRRSAHRQRPLPEQHPGVLPQRRHQPRMDLTRRRRRVRQRRRHADPHRRNARPGPGPGARRGHQLLVPFPLDPRLRQPRRAHRSTLRRTRVRRRRVQLERSELSRNELGSRRPRTRSVGQIHDKVLRVRGTLEPYRCDHLSFSRSTSK